MIDRGIFSEDERLELLDGALVVKEPQGDPHAAAVDLAIAALRQAFGTGWLVRAHAPLGYWIVNLVEQVVEVHRDPAPLESPKRGWVYRSAPTLPRGVSWRRCRVGRGRRCRRSLALAPSCSTTLPRR